MIRALLNLRCPRGHRFFSPTPEAWVGRYCVARNGKVCQHVLQRDLRPRRR